MPGKEKVLCPILSASHKKEVECFRASCEWWRGNNVDGCCAVWDLAGWVSNLYQLASGNETENLNKTSEKNDKKEPAKPKKPKRKLPVDSPIKILKKEVIEPDAEDKEPENKEPENKEPEEDLPFVLDDDDEDDAIEDDMEDDIEDDE